MVRKGLMHKEIFPKLKGHVRIVGTDVYSGLQQFCFDNHNLITFAERDVLGELLVQQTLLPGARPVADLVIDSMRMGTSNATPDRTDTDLQGTTVVTKTFTAPNVSKISPGVYSFAVSMITSEGNGNTFYEVGLFTDDSTMLARQVHASFFKDNTLQVDYTWTITFS